MYARFFTKALADLDVAPRDLREPFSRLFTQGMIRMGGSKMSKSKGNLVAPEQYLDTVGADSLRLFHLFVGPPQDDVDWDDAVILVRDTNRTVLSMSNDFKGDLTELFEAAGLHHIEESHIAVSVEHPSFEEWWEPFTLGVGPAGSYAAGGQIFVIGSLLALCGGRVIRRMRAKLAQVAACEDVDERWASVVGFEEPTAGLRSARRHRR
jgi:hypothetical protein